MPDQSSVRRRRNSPKERSLRFGDSNSSELSDGAAAVLLMKRSIAGGVLWEFVRSGLVSPDDSDKGGGSWRIYVVFRRVQVIETPLG